MGRRVIELCQVDILAGELLPFFNYVLLEAHMKNKHPIKVLRAIGSRGGIEAGWKVPADVENKFRSWLGLCLLVDAVRRSHPKMLTGRTVRCKVPV